MKNSPFLQKTQLVYNPNLEPNTSRVTLKGLELKSAAKVIGKLQDRFESENIIIVDDFELKNLKYFLDLNLVKRSAFDDQALPAKHHRMFCQRYNRDHESRDFFKLIKKRGFVKGSFKQHAISLIDTLTSLMKKSFPDYRFELMEPTWRFYPVCIGALHVDEFDHHNHRQVLRLLINLDHLPRVLAFSEPVWSTISRYESIVKPDWPDTISECVRYFQKRFLEEQKLERYNIDMNLVLLKPGSFWIGNPSALSHCGVAGFKALVLDFEFNCADYKEKTKSFKSKWETVTGKTF